MLWGDFIKFVRSSIFKNEFEDIDVTAKNAENDESGRNIMLTYAERESINHLIDCYGYFPVNVFVRGQSTSSIVAVDRYSCVLKVEITDIGQDVRNFKLSGFTGFAVEPTVTYDEGEQIVTISGYALAANITCSASVTYERKPSYLT